MSHECEALHNLVRGLERHEFPYDRNLIPRNGIYILFEVGETGHEQDRIVRVGTHSGDGNLRSRLRQHFLIQNKDQSIFRKNIGRALLKQAFDPFLEHWNRDLTTRAARAQYAHLIDFDNQQQIENQVSQYIQESFSFCVIEVNCKEERLLLESRMISTVSLCDECRPAGHWLGNSSPIERIRQSGLWLVNELYKTPLGDAGLEQLRNRIRGQ